MPENRERVSPQCARRGVFVPCTSDIRPTRGSALVLALLATLFLFASSPAHAKEEKPVLVVLLRPVPAGDILNETLLRIRSELLAGGFQVVLLDSVTSDTTPWTLVESAGQALAPSATIGIFGDLAKGLAELWVADRITGKTVVRRLDVQASSGRRISEILAIRAQELLRASLVECLMKVDQVGADAPASPPLQVHHFVDGALAFRSAPWTLGLELGITTFSGWGGLGPTLAPAARLRLALGERLWSSLTAVGLGTRPRVETATASASVSQNILLVEIAYCLKPRRLVRPVFTLGLGAERLAVDGTAVLPYQGEHNARWFAAGDAGLGVSFRLHAHWEMQFEVHALFTTPRPSVRFLDTEAASAGQPTMLAILTLAGGA